MVTVVSLLVEFYNKCPLHFCMLYLDYRLTRIACVLISTDHVTDSQVIRETIAMCLKET